MQSLCDSLWVMIGIDSLTIFGCSSYHTVGGLGSCQRVRGPGFGFQGCDVRGPAQGSGVKGPGSNFPVC